MREMHQVGRRSTSTLGRWSALSLALLAPFVFACASDEEKVAGFKTQAEAYVEQEKLREAVIEYRNVLQIDPNDVDAHRGLAEAYLLLGSVKDAYWELSESIRLNPDDRESRNTYAAIALANGRFDVVLEQADALVATDPDDATGLVLQAQAYERLDREDEVEAKMRKVIEAHPEKTEYRLLLSNFYMRQDRPVDARQEADRAMEIEPTYNAASQVARLIANDPDTSDDIDAYLRLVIDLAVKEQEARETADEPKGKDERAAAYSLVAAYYASQDRYEDAVMILEEASTELVDVPEDRRRLLSDLSTLHRVQGDHERADDAMQRAAAADEGNPEAFLMLSTIRSSQEDWDGALEASEKALAIDPTMQGSRLRHAEVLIEFGTAKDIPEKLAEGLAEVEAILAERPGLPEGLFVLAKYQVATNEIPKAIESLVSALEAKPDWAQARILLGSALLAQGDFARARVEVALGLELTPGSVRARRILTRIHAALGEHEYAVEQGRIYLARQPDDGGIRIVVAQSLIRLGRVEDAKAMLSESSEESMGADGLFALARIELATGNLVEARRLLEKVEVEMPHHVRVLESFVSLDRLENRLSESEARIAAAIEANPDAAGLWQLQGVFATVQGDIALAESSYEKAIELDPKLLGAYENLASLYSSQGRIDETIAIYERAIAEDPTAAHSHHFLAVLYEMTGKRDLAAEYYAKAIELDDSMAESKNNLAYMLASEGTDLDRALTLAQEAKAAMPGNPNTADTLGWVLLKRGVSSAAVGYFREALANLPRDNPARGEVGYHLGLGYVAAGQPEDATKAFNEALEHLDAQLDAARSRGESVGEPPWASQVRAELAKLEG